MTEQDEYASDDTALSRCMERLAWMAGRDRYGPEARAALRLAYAEVNEARHMVIQTANAAREVSHGLD